MTYDQAVAWLQEHRALHIAAHSYAVADKLYDVLAVLEREHEEAERLRSRLEMIHAACASYEECPVDARDRPESWARLWRLLDAARKGVSDG